MKRSISLGLSLALTIGFVAAGIAVAGDGRLPAAWQDVRAGVARYHSWAQAQADGYVIPPGEPCVSAPPGTMGFHALNFALIADPAIDPLRPEILVYAPGGDGSLKLVAVEYWKADADQSLATDGDRPSVLGVPFDGPMPGHNPQMPVHYDLHVWLAERNPSGLFAPFNPALSC